MATSTPAKERARGTRIAIAALIGVVGVLCYLPLLQGTHSFVAFDDDIAVYLNPHIRSLDGESIRWFFTDATYWCSYNPLYWLGYAINYRFGGLDPLGYHAVNLALHLLNGLLLFQLLGMLLRTSPEGLQRPERHLDVIAGVAALLWVVHPLRVEAVAWAATRLYPQSVFFLLICLVAYLRAAASAVSPFRSAWYWGAVLAYVASLGTHQLGLTLVGILIVLDVYPLRRLHLGQGRFWDGPARRIWLEKLPFLAVAIAAGAIALWARSYAAGICRPSPTLLEFPLSHRAAQALYIWAHYVWKPWWPLHLSPTYTTLVWFDPASPAFVLSAVLVVAATALAVGLRRKYPAALAAWSCHLILLTPVLGLFDQPHYPSDRYSYLQGVVWSAVAAAALVSLHDRLRTRIRPIALLLAPACLLVASAVATARQVRVWTDSETLFRHILAGLGENLYKADIHERLGKYYLVQGRFADAIAQFDQTLALFPDEPQVLHLKGTALIRMAGDAAGGRQPTQASIRLFLDAAVLLDRSAAIHPMPEVLGAAGLALAYARQFRPAEERFVRGLQLAPGDFRLRSGLGMVLYRQGRTAEAREQLELAIRAAPELADQREQIVRGWSDFAPSPDE